MTDILSQTLVNTSTISNSTSAGVPLEYRSDSFPLRPAVIHTQAIKIFAALHAASIPLLINVTLCLPSIAFLFLGHFLYTMSEHSRLVCLQFGTQNKFINVVCCDQLGCTVERAGEIMAIAQLLRAAVLSWAVQ